MLRARISYKFVGFVSRALPPGIASSLIQALRLKIPTSPAALAASLLTMTGSILKGIEKAKTDFKAAGITKQEKIAETDEAAGEVLCALYCLAVAILGEDEFAAERTLFQLFTAKTFEELQNLLSDLPTTKSMENLADETTNLYLRERPSLSEMAQQIPRSVSSVEVQQVEEM